MLRRGTVSAVLRRIQPLDHRAMPESVRRSDDSRRNQLSGCGRDPALARARGRVEGDQGGGVVHREAHDSSRASRTAAAASSMLTPRPGGGCRFGDGRGLMAFYAADPDQNLHGLQILLGRHATLTSPRRGPSTGSDHCSPPRPRPRRRHALTRGVTQSSGEVTAARPLLTCSAYFATSGGTAAWLSMAVSVLRTDSTVRAFQSVCTPSDVDGIVGTNTWRQLHPDISTC
jgi:hypothetical protein